MKVITGGQNGVDLLALQAAKQAELPTGGFAPPDFMTITGPNPELGSIYGLVEAGTANQSAAYIMRSKMNVDAAHVVIAIYLKESAGTGKTIEYAKTGIWPKAQPPRIDGNQFFVEVENSKKPLLVVFGFREHPTLVVAAIQNFLRKHKPSTVNVCGNREVDSEEAVRELLYMAFRPFGKK